MLLIVLLLAHVLARTQDRDRWPNPPLGFNSGDLPAFDFSEWRDEAEEIEEHNEPVVIAPPTVEDLIWNLVHAMPTTAPEDCTDMDSDYCCRHMMYDLENRIAEAMLTSHVATALGRRTNIEWESKIIDTGPLDDPNEDTDDNSMSFSCRAFLTFPDDPTFEPEIALIPKIFKMECILPYLRRYLEVYRTRHGQLDTVGVCVNRKRKRTRFERPGVRVMSDYFRPGSRITEAQESEEVHAGSSVCYDVSSDMFNANSGSDTESSGGSGRQRAAQMIAWLSQQHNMIYNEGKY